MAIGAVHNLDVVLIVGLAGYQFASIGVLVHHHLPHAQRGLHASLVEQELTESDVLLVGASQAGDVAAGRLLEVEFAIVVGLHHGAQRARGFRHTGEAKERASGYRHTAVVVNGAIGAVAHHLAVARNHNLTTREGMFAHTQIANRVHLGQQRVAQAHLRGQAIAQSRGGEMNAMTSVKALLGAFESHGDGQRTSGGISAKDGLGGIVLGKGGVLVGHHHAMRAARCDGRAIALDVVGATQQCEHHIFIAGGKFRRHFHRRGIGACGSDQY